MLTHSKNINRTKTVVHIVPVDNDGTLIAGVEINRKGYNSCRLILFWAASSGTPDTATAKLELFADTVTGMGMGTEAQYGDDIETALDIKAAGLKVVDVDLSGVKQFIRFKVDTTYTGGTTPKNLIGAAVILGDAVVEPPESVEFVQ